MKTLATQTPQIETLSNGMKVLLMPSRYNSIVALACFLPLPGAIERPEEAGLVSFTHRMLLRGTKTRSSKDLSEAIESLGSSLESETSDDFSFAHVVSTSDCFEESLVLLADVLQNPSFEPEEIEKERLSTLAAIRRREDDKFSLTIQHFLRQLYGSHSYGFSRLGYTDTVGEFRRDQLTHLHEEFFDPSEFLIVCTGDLDPKTIAGMLDSLFVPRNASEPKFQISGPQFPPPSEEQFSRECEQAFLAAGFPACGILSPDFPALRVLNAILGEGMSSRLFIKLRDDQGLAYSTGSSFSPMQKGGHLLGYIGTKPESLSIAREGMLKEFDEIKTTLVPGDELERAKNYIIGKFLIDHQTNYKRAYYPGFYEMIGLGLAMDEEYPRNIAGVTAQKVRDVANKYLTIPTITELIPTSS